MATKNKHERTFEIIESMIGVVEYVKDSADESVEDGFIESAEVMYGAAWACASAGLKTCAAMLIYYSVKSTDFDNTKKVMGYIRSFLDAIDEIVERLSLILSTENTAVDEM